MKPIPKIPKSAAVQWAGTQSELARRLGVSDQAVSQWGEDSLPEGRIWQLVVLGCPHEITEQEMLPAGPA